MEIPQRRDLKATTGRSRIHAQRFDCMYIDIDKLLESVASSAVDSLSETPWSFQSPRSPVDSTPVRHGRAIVEHDRWKTIRGSERDSCTLTQFSDRIYCCKDGGRLLWQRQHIFPHRRGASIPW
jgi:hypothetical protein